MLSGIQVERRLWAEVRAALTAGPVVALTGPRTSGKSTLVRRLVAELGGTYLDLDDPAVQVLARSDPGAFVRDLAEPIAIDEFQRAPEVLAAIKAELNRDYRPGRYLLAGSARHDVVPELADYLTGRVELSTLWPFAMAELEPGAASIVDRIRDGSAVRVRRTEALGRADLVRLVLRGGYPIANALDGAARDRWFRNLATLVVERTADDVEPVRHRETLAKCLRLAAARTAQLATAADIGREIGLGRDQAGFYLRLLERAYLTLRLPAWSSNPTSREIKRPKLHLVDSGLAAHLVQAREGGLSPVDPAGATRFGALLETFVVTEVLKQVGWAREPVTLHHYRSVSGAGVDLVLEYSDGCVAGIEVKAAATAGGDAGRGLAQLRDRIGDRFVGGLVLTTGPHAQSIADRLAVAPIDVLWRE
ncbi:MAG: ATP-binding protein [Sporichthyaceae bacterium]